MADPQEPTDWAEVPEAPANQVQTPSGTAEPTDWAEVPEQSAAGGLSEVAKGFGKSAVRSALDYAGPIPAGIMHMDTHIAPIEDFKKGLESSNTDQSIGSGIETAAELAVPVIGGVKSLIRAGKGLLGAGDAATAAMHGDIQGLAAKVAGEAGVAVPKGLTVRQSFGAAADAITQKANDITAKLDEVFSSQNPTKHFSRDPFGSGKMTKGTADSLDMVGDYGSMQKNINKLEQKAGSLIGPANAEKRAAVLEDLAEARKTKQVADKMLDNSGLGNARAEADALFKQADDLRDLHKSVNQSTKGITRSGAPGAEKVNAAQLNDKLEAHYADGSLQSAVGESNSHDLLDSVGRTARIQTRSQAMKDAGKTVMKYGAATVGLGAAAHHATAIGGAVAALTGQ